MGEKLADKLSGAVGSWAYIGIQTTIFSFWVFLNLSAPRSMRPDPYPFSFLNLLVGFMSAYTGPVLLISANRQSERDRKKILESLALDRTIQFQTDHIDHQLDEIQSILKEVKEQQGKIQG